MPLKLNPEEVTQGLLSLKGWSVNASGELTKTFSFENYKDGIVFASAVGFLADQMDHHPEMLVGYCRVVVSLSTHSAQGLTNLDFQLAAKTETLLA